MVLEGLFATGEVSSMSPAAAAAAAAAAASSFARKGKRVTWEANVAGGYPTTKATVGGALNPAVDTIKAMLGMKIRMLYYTMKLTPRCSTTSLW
jgi:hypothetical protein